ncbi:hypothetical protein ACRRTK_019714 [Alexandromys fortis]
MQTDEKSYGCVPTTTKDLSRCIDPYSCILQVEAIGTHVTGGSMVSPSESLVVCDVAEDLVEKLRKFRFRKETHNAAIIMKIDKDKRLVVLDEELELSADIFYMACKEDGRTVGEKGSGCKPEQQMMYAGSKNKLVQTAELTKVFEIRNTEDLTEEWLREKLGFFH